MELNTKRYVITGGPGSGKSTLVEALERAGFSCSEEISRKMIKAEVAKGSDCLPWMDIACFSDKVIAEMIIAWSHPTEHALTFFDRGIPDVIAYLHLAGLPVPENYLNELSLHPYEKKVFILPPWKDIYVNDDERWQSFEEAEAIYRAIRATYSGLDFELIGLPKDTAAKRVKFILDHLK